MNDLLTWERGDTLKMVGKYEYGSGCFESDIKYDHLTDRWYVSFSGGIYTNETYKELEDAAKYAEESCNKFASVINRVISNETKASEQITRFLDGEEA